MLKGIAASDGIGIGTVVTVKETEIKYEPRAVEDKEAEKKRLKDAIADFLTRTQALAEQMEKSVNAKDAEIMYGHIAMMSDPFMGQQMEEQIDSGACAESAAETVLNMFRDMFAAADDELTKQRATDVEDIKTRLLKILLGIEDTDLASLPPDNILVTRDLTPSMTAQMNHDSVVGIVTESGGMTSHSAILSRALEIPAVLSVKDAVSILEDGSRVIVDGLKGEVLEGPAEEDFAEYKKAEEKFLAEKEALKAYIGRETLTADGIHKEVFCNIGNPDDARTARERDGEGVGLFRTEFLFMDADSIPSEEDQYKAYKKACVNLQGKTVIIRTLDVGGDKEISYMNIPKEENPFLGYRAIRWCLDHPEEYEKQLRALIRANADTGGNLWIMVPMVTSVAEIKAVRSLAKSICDDLALPMPKIGSMIETPAAFIMADKLAGYCDFFSIGTNDLTQYVMASDRGNSKVAYLYNTYDPAVLRAIKGVIEAGKKAGITVGMCGEAAAAPELIPLLISFGLDEFSVSPTSVLRTRAEIARWTKDEADRVAGAVMELETAEEVKEYLDRELARG
ncbi:MAG: phosphoenolpyruvate--protein phosphotransferase [Eubacteriales bacterium]|nr:phosphoenolpyruvate--protein phosphotransferase [Eubacteriales bacterium]